MASKRIVVFGGSGFLGSRICRAAAARNWDVTSVRQAFNPSKGAESPNPLERVRQRGGDPNKEGRWRAVEPPASPAQMTYEMMNRDSAILLAKEAAKEGVKAFGFVSAAAGAPVLPSRYITTKREAEQVVAREFPEMRGVFFRPPFMFDQSRAVTMGVAAAATAGSFANRLAGGVLEGFLGAAVTKPLKVDLVADAIVEALEDESVKGPVEVPQLEELANRAWRKTML
ncbi:hypothetical protein N0V88_001951 [Collariella sp. IMI 366227]|nr:hypothetical protein N0V88_001951 [Collariella sp. IMI 366227]